MTGLHELSATELAAAIERREVSSREALTHLVERVDKLDGPLNSVVTRDLERAFAAADAADAATARGERIGPLHGVPMTVKDSFSTAGMRTTSGAPGAGRPRAGARTPRRSPRCAEPVRSSGARRTCRSTPGTCRATTRSSARPATRGTSSARRAVPRAARRRRWPPGSRRWSSAPTSAGRSGCPPTCRASTATSRATASCPPTGRSPGPPGTLTQADIAVAGPMARTVADLDLALGLMSGPDRWNRPGMAARAPAASRPRSCHELRVAHVVRRRRLPARSRGGHRLARLRRPARRRRRPGAARGHARVRSDQGGGAVPGARQRRHCRRLQRRRRWRSSRWPKATTRSR